MDKKDRNHLNLLYDIGDLADLLTGCEDMESFLQRTAELVAEHLSANVCSIYLYDGNTDELILKATKGLNPNAVNIIRMKPGEGLVGFSFEKFTDICEGDATRNPNFKYFIEADEDPYNSFLSVPIKRGIEKIGVIAVQHEDKDYFDDLDIRALRTTASQLAGSIENVRLLMQLNHQDYCLPVPSSEKIANLIRGESVSAGYAFGPAMVLKKNREATLLHAHLREENYTVEDLHKAIEKTSLQLKSMQSKFSERLPESASLIFTAHFMILKDKNFSGKMIELIEKGHAPAEAVRTVARHYISQFSSSAHPYMREKAMDVEDLAVRILSNFHNSAEEVIPDRKRVVITSELYPSDIIKLAAGEVLGIIFIGGGITSHVSILSRSLQIPFILSDETDILNLPEETPVLMDADLGNIYVNPSTNTIRLFDSRKSMEKKAFSQGSTMSDITETADGTRVHLMANINLLSEVPLAKTLKAEGIGLYRTEFPFLIRPTFPSEEEQYIIYKKLFDSMKDQVVTIRTLDVGGEKVLAYSASEKQNNPELGLRSIRFSLKNPDIFNYQIRAILRAAANTTNSRIMFPLVSSIDELLEAKTIIRNCMADLTRENLEFNKDISIGMLVEIPSVLETIDEFAKEADFFSIGTNDFIQYMLAADRTNKMVSDYYIPYHPSVVRGLHKIAKAAEKTGIDVTVCGEMAHETKYIPFLIGIGIRSLSIDPQFLPLVQQRIASLEISEARRHAADLLSETTIQGALKVVEKSIN